MYPVLQNIIQFFRSYKIFPILVYYLKRFFQTNKLLKTFSIFQYFCETLHNPIVLHYCSIMKMIMPVATQYLSCHLASLDPPISKCVLYVCALFVASHLFFSEGHARGHYTLPRTCFECSSVLSPVAASTASQCCPGSDSSQQQLHETAVKPIFPPILVVPAALCLQLKNLCLNFPNLLLLTD